MNPSGASLDYGLVVGLFLAVLKLADFFVRPHQKAKIKSFLEDMTLWLDDLDTRSLGDRFSEPGVAFIMFASAFIFYVPVVAGASIATNILFYGPDYEHFSFFSIPFLLSTFALTFLLPTLGYRWGFRAVVEFAVAANVRKEERVAKLRSRSRWLVYGGLFFGGFASKLLDYPIVPHNEWLHLPITVATYTSLTLGCTAKLCHAVLASNRTALLPRIVIAISRGFLWRVVENANGPVAALVLIVTVVFLSN